MRTVRPPAAACPCSGTGICRRGGQRSALCSAPLTRLVSQRKPPERAKLERSCKAKRAREQVRSLILLRVRTHKASSRSLVHSGLRRTTRIRRRRVRPRKRCDRTRGAEPSRGKRAPRPPKSSPPRDSSFSLSSRISSTLPSQSFAPVAFAGHHSHAPTQPASFSLHAPRRETSSRPPSTTPSSQQTSSGLTPAPRPQHALTSALPLLASHACSMRDKWRKKRVRLFFPRPLAGPRDLRPNLSS